jgi:hypothetical protein
MTLDTSGNMSSVTWDTVGQDMTSIGANAIAVSMNSTGASSIASKITSIPSANANIIVDSTSSANLPGTPTAGGYPIAVACNGAGRGGLLQGAVGSAGNPTIGGGFTSAHVASGEYTVSYNVPFGANAVATVTTYGIPGLIPYIISTSNSGFTVGIVSIGGTPTDTDFLFTVLGNF